MSNGGIPWQGSMEETFTGGMRRRQHTGAALGGGREPQRSGEGTAFSKAVQRFDVYARVDDDLQVKTEAGAAVTISFWVLMVLLVCGEVAAYLRGSPATERVLVDSTIGQKLRINANIVSPVCCHGKRRRCCIASAPMLCLSV